MKLKKYARSFVQPFKPSDAPVRLKQATLGVFDVQRPITSNATLAPQLSFRSGRTPTYTYLY